MSVNVFEKRRARLQELLGERGVLVVLSTPVFIRNNDVHHEYRQSSDFFYLTGFDEANTALVLRGGAEGGLTLFVPPRDREREVWDGPRAGVEGATAQFGAKAAHPIGDLETKLPELLKGCEQLHCSLGVYDEHDRTLLAALKRAQKLVRRGGTAPRQIIDASESLHEMRRLKGPAEVESLRRAIAITDTAHRSAMQLCRPGRFEYEIEAELRRVFRQHGSERPAYAPIVGSGANATTLHHIRNQRQIQRGDLVLVDAGCEFDYYAADITRTFPADGRFSAVQRQMYELVLEAQAAALAKVRPGATFPDLQTAVLEVLCRGFIEARLIEGPLDVAIAEERYKPFYMHGIGHYLGMDVHDVGRYFDGDVARGFEPGVVITVEPGVYIAPDAPGVPDEYRGIGIRIEDDVLVTAGGYENLSSAIPKTIADIESLMAR
jgi:Xaa-Pro aminopeptidase